MKTFHTFKGDDYYPTRNDYCGSAETLEEALLIPSPFGGPPDWCVVWQTQTDGSLKIVHGDR